MNDDDDVSPEPIEVYRRVWNNRALIRDDDTEVVMRALRLLIVAEASAPAAELEEMRRLTDEAFDLLYGERVE